MQVKLEDRNRIRDKFKSLMAHPHYHTQWSPNIIQWFMHEAMWNMLYKAWSVLSRESTQYVPNFTPFLNLSTEFYFLKGASISSLNCSPCKGIMKYVMQSLKCVKQGINPISAKFHTFPEIIKWVLFPERSKYEFSQL